MKRCYLAIFGLPKPQPEHAKIVEVIRAASGGEFKQFIVPGGIGFMYESEELPWNLSFSRILHNGDTKLIVEIGEKVLLEGYGAAQGWLNTRRPRQ
ncbi:hypothetical protein [Caldimonas sp.]|uniref:hypothetical protein n=1 Tax=Caldimonas sp. TaxID=2838790 RepID=UPI00391C363D